MHSGFGFGFAVKNRQQSHFFLFKIRDLYMTEFDNVIIDVTAPLEFMCMSGLMWEQVLGPISRANIVIISPALVYAISSCIARVPILFKFPI